MSPAPAELGRPLWGGERGRTEVWYATFTDATSGLGGWVHAETVAPTDGSPGYGHGWFALFPPATQPFVERFGPGAVQQEPGSWFQLDDVTIAEGALRGRTATGWWDLTCSSDGPPLFTFPRRVWERQLLPGAQVVPYPTSRVEGQVAWAGTEASVSGPGAVARIFGHGSAQRWGWLHAALPEGGVLEIVTATARRPGLRRLAPRAMVQLRLPGARDWPANPLLACTRFHTVLHPDGFAVEGRHRGHRLRVDVELPALEAVELLYTDPDGSTATCRNSERATVTIAFDDRRWRLDGTAHAEVGTRP